MLWDAEINADGVLTVDLPDLGIWLRGPVSEKKRAEVVDLLSRRGNMRHIGDRVVMNWQYLPVSLLDKVMDMTTMQKKLVELFPSAILTVDWVFVEPLDFAIMKLSAA